ncbi:MAG TPA: lytic transglycosylase domain-containing protein [Symbiobacteriaceae bacterium]|nr:lytic transglycosylase domain-containing protein [Symbiobacteriaceae bacterium]
MLRRLRRRRSVWAAIAVGLMAVPALFGGVAAAPADANNPLPQPELDPLATLPPSPAELEARLVLSMADSIADLAPEAYRMPTVLAARRYQVDPRLLAAIVTVETEWDPHAVGLHGELGLMQILPSTGAHLAKEAGLTEYDLAEPATSLMLGAQYISALVSQYGTIQRALAAYNGGPIAAESPETNLYARKVMKWFRLGKPAVRPHQTERAA